MKCKLCARMSREGESLCRYHSEALVALKRGYERWNEAYSGLSWIGYLNRVKTAHDTGQWVKDVITLEQSNTT